MLHMRNAAGTIHSIKSHKYYRFITNYYDGNKKNYAMGKICSANGKMIRNAYKMLVVKCEAMRLFERFSRRGEVNNEIDLRNKA